MAGALAGCVTSLQSSIALLDSSISILDTGVNDFPRLSKTLQSTRVCEIMSQFPLLSYYPILLLYPSLYLFDLSSHIT
jgi:DASH complex subunit SPC19